MRYNYWLDALTAPERSLSFMPSFGHPVLTSSWIRKKKVIPTGYKLRSYPEKWFGFLSKLVLAGVTLKTHRHVTYFQTMRNRLLAHSFDPISDEYGAVKLQACSLIPCLLLRDFSVSPDFKILFPCCEIQSSCDLESLATLMAAGGLTRT